MKRTTAKSHENAHSTRSNRQSHRYRGYDYASAGAYFVTICVQHGRCLLGEVVAQEMIVNDAGRVVEQCWHELPARFPTIALDAFQVMPNHVHLITWLRADVGGPLAAPAQTNEPTGAASSPPTSGGTLKDSEQFPRLDQVMRAFKSLSAIQINRLLNRSGRLWQRDYWDRIIRDDIELEQLRSYIRTNPARWDDDALHPEAPPNQFNRWNTG